MSSENSPAPAIHSPPSIVITSPLIYPDSSLIKYEARFSSSCLSPNLFIGILFFILSSKSSKPGGINLDHAPFVGNGPGAIALNLILCLPHSTASDLVIAKTPALAAAEGTTKGEPVHAYVVTMLSIFPLLFFIISFPIVLVQFHVPIKTISITALNAL